MPSISTKDGTKIFYKDWGEGQPIVFSHGWPLSSDDWDVHMFFFLQHGYRVIAHDRRGHGRSSQPAEGHDMDHYADDLAAVTEHLDLHDAIHIGHSTGGGEVARYVGRYGTKRVAKVVLISAIPPLLVKTEANPNGLPKEAIDQLLGGIRADRAQFFKDFSIPFYGFNRPGAKVSEGLRDSFVLQSLLAGFPNVYAFTQSADFTEDLKNFDVPTLIMHGDDDQVVPIAITSLVSSKIVKGATLKVYPGLPHGMCSTHKDLINADLLEFIKKAQTSSQTA